MRGEMYDKENRRKSAGQSFCQCFNKTSETFRLNMNNMAQLKSLIESCKCGENESNELEWNWDSTLDRPTSQISQNLVLFHPVYSQGTAVVRGEKALQLGCHHFWEIKMTSPVCGTDLMVGIGTEQMDLAKNKYKFVSALGEDNQSWGFSYRGMIQTNGQLKYYGKKFTKGSIVGIGLDLFRGKMEFYINRIPLGIAFQNIPVDGSNKYYPMVSSTAAKSSIKLINSTSFPESLQYLAIKTISKHPSLLSDMKKCPGFVKYSKVWYLQTDRKFQYSDKSDQKTQFPNSKRYRIEDDLLNPTEPEIPEKRSREDDKVDIYENMDEIQEENSKTSETEEDEEEVEDYNDEIEIIRPSDLIYSFFCDHDLI